MAQIHERGFAANEFCTYESNATLVRGGKHMNIIRYFLLALVAYGLMTTHALAATGADPFSLTNVAMLVLVLAGLVGVPRK